jgi:hypothetical protein
MSRRSIALIVALLVAVLVLATVLDVLAPIGASRFLTVFDLPFARAPGGAGQADFGPSLLRARLPRGVRAVAGVAALSGYGLLLRYLAAERLATLARATTGAPARLARLAVSGAAALALGASLTLLAAVSTIAGPLVPLLGIGLTLAALTGLVALALPVGQHIRGWVGAIEPAMLGDLLTGLLAITLIALFPVVGTVALALAMLVGLGAAAATRLGAAERWSVDPFEY